MDKKVIAIIEKTFFIFSNLHDPNTELHAMRTAELCLRLAQRLNMTGADTEDLRFIAIFHDIGKVGIDRHILNKPGALTDGEWAMVKQHPIWGCRILMPLGLKEHIHNAVRAHHENYDGTGYPDGLEGEGIPFYARIVRIADTLDALTSSRPDRDAVSIKDAFDVMWKYQNCFDPVLLNEFEQMLNRKKDE